MSILEWVEEPPPVVRHGARASTATRRYDSFAEQLAASPGRWAILGKFALKTEATGCRAAMRSRGCESKIRRQHDGEGLYVVYARCPV